MNAKEIQTVRQSLRLIATGETMEARKMLAGLTMGAGRTPQVKAARPVSRACFLCSDTSHDASDVWTVPAGPHKYAFKPAHVECVAREDEKVSAIFAEIDRRRGQSTYSEETAVMCLCGHGYQAHKVDSLENRLDCEARQCECDHFRPGGIVKDVNAAIETDTESEAA